MNKKAKSYPDVCDQIVESLSKNGYKFAVLLSTGTTDIQAVLDNKGTIGAIVAPHIVGKIENDPDSKFIAIFSPEGAEELARDLIECATKAREENGNVIRQ